MKQMDFDELADAIFVKLFRVWSTARETDTNPLSATFGVAKTYGLPDHAAVTCSSLFELVENESDRPLVRECCCCRTFSSDEKALLAVLSVANTVRLIRASSQVPHGLSGAICWAALAVRDCLGLKPMNLGTSASCPFAFADQAWASCDRQYFESAALVTFTTMRQS